MEKTEPSYSLRSHKGMRDDLEAAAKYFHIPYYVTEDIKEIIISVPIERKHNFINGFFSGEWRKKEVTSDENH